MCLVQIQMDIGQYFRDKESIKTSYNGNAAIFMGHLLLNSLNRQSALYITEHGAPRLINHIQAHRTRPEKTIFTHKM